MQIKEMLLKMLSGTDDVSLNRTLGALIAINLVVIMWVALFTQFDMARFELVFNSSIYLIVILLGLKGIEKVVGYFKK